MRFGLEISICIIIGLGLLDIVLLLVALRLHMVSIVLYCSTNRPRIKL